MASWTALAVAFLSAGAVVYDIYGRGYRQQMRVMEAVWPVTALYAGPLANLGAPTDSIRGCIVAHESKTG